MLNRVILQGRLVADPELRHTQNNIAVATMRIAVDRNFVTRDANGNRQSQADFINLVAWRQTAENIARFFTKGRMILIEGSLQTRDYTDKDGNRRFITEVQVDSFQFCESRRDGAGNGNGGSYGGNSYGAPNGYSAPAAPAAPAAPGYNAAPSYNAAPNAYAPQQAMPANDFAELNDNEDGDLPF